MINYGKGYITLLTSKRVYTVIFQLHWGLSIGIEYGHDEPLPWRLTFHLLVMDMTFFTYTRHQS